MPDLVLSIIFSHLNAFERICKVSQVCKKWYSLVNSSSQVRKCADFAYNRKITSDVLEKFIYPGTTTVLLNECCYLQWEDLKVILKKCKRIHVLSLPWIGYLDITELRTSQLQYLTLSQCLLSDKQFHEIALKCKRLSILILHVSRGISKEAFESSCFKSHHHLRLMNVPYVPEALKLSTVSHLLQYSNNIVKLVITGHKLSDEDPVPDTIERIDSTALARIVEIEDYRHLLYC